MKNRGLISVRTVVEPTASVGFQPSERKHMCKTVWRFCVKWISYKNVQKHIRNSKKKKWIFSLYINVRKIQLHLFKHISKKNIIKIHDLHTYIYIYIYIYVCIYLRIPMRHYRTMELTRKSHLCKQYLHLPTNFIF